jgi:hypothetical protein
VVAEESVGQYAQMLAAMSVNVTGIDRRKVSASQVVNIRVLWPCNDIPGATED